MSKKKLIVVAKDKNALESTVILIDKTFDDADALICQSTAEAIGHLQNGPVDLIVYVVDFTTPRQEECEILKDLSSVETLVPVFFYYLDGR